MIWTQQAAALLARYGCDICRGEGLLAAAGGGDPLPCACVCRRVFHACFRRFRQCAEADSFARLVTFTEYRPGVDRHLMWIRRNEDYCADFQACARRALSPELYRVFRFHHLLGAGSEMLARRLSMPPRAIYRAIAEIEERMGREFALMQPYSLYPPRAYLGWQPATRLPVQPEARPR